MNYFGFYQELLISGSNIKTLTSQSMLGSGNYDVLMKFSNGWSLQVPDNTATGGNARGTGAVDLQTSRSVNTQVASGIRSIAAGESNTVTSLDSGAFGALNQVNTGGYSFAFGYSNTITGSTAVSFGTSNTSSGALSSCFGVRATSNNVRCKQVIACDAVGATLGSAQVSFIPVGELTTDATPTVLTSDGLTPNATNQSTLQNNSSHNILCLVVARASATGDTATWRIEAAIKRGANASTTTIIGTPTVTMLFNDAGAAAWTVGVTADTTNGSLALAVTGEAAKTIHWAANLITTEVI